MHIGVQYLAIKEWNTGEQCGLSLIIFQIKLNFIFISDILGDGNVRPVDLMRGPSWLRGFRGNEMQRIIRQLKYQEATIRQLYP
jgi:hypothetical protein